MPTTRYDPDLLDRIDRKRKKKRRESCLSRLLLMILILSIIIAVFFVWVLTQKNKKKPIETPGIETSWYEQTFDVLFSSITPTQTDTFTPTLPTPTVTQTNTMTPTVSLTPTQTPTPRLRTRTPSGGNQLPTSTPLLLLNAAETEIANLKIAKTSISASSTPAATPDMWFEIQGQPGATNAEIIYPNAECSWMGVAGLVNDARGDPIIGLYVQVGNFPDGEIRETLTGLFPIYGESGYEITIARPVIEIPQPLWIQLLNESHVPVSEKVYFKPSNSCERSLILINFKRVR